MVRSLHYAAVCDGEVTCGGFRRDRPQSGEVGPQSRYGGGVFRRAYLVAAGEVGFFQTNQAELKGQFQTFLWMYAVQELGNELHSRPNWAIVPLDGI